MHFDMITCITTNINFMIIWMLMIQLCTSCLQKVVHLIHKQILTLANEPLECNEQILVVIIIILMDST